MRDDLGPEFHPKDELLEAADDHIRSLRDRLSKADAEVARLRRELADARKPGDRVMFVEGGLIRAHDGTSYGATGFEIYQLAWVQTVVGSTGVASGPDAVEEIASRIGAKIVDQRPEARSAPRGPIITTHMGPKTDGAR